MRRNKTGVAVVILLVMISSSCKKDDDTADANSPVKDPVSILPKTVAWELDAEKSDEFTTLDANKWGWGTLWYSVSADLAYKTENTVVTDGKASLVAKKESYNGKLYTGGCMKSKFQVGGNTYIEIRAKMVNAPANVCAALWLGDDPSEVNNPNIEIDIQETKDADNAPHRLNSSLLTWPKPGNSNTVPGSKLFYISKGLDEAFHLYGLERRDGKLRFYLDGINYWEWDATATPAFVTQLRPIVLSLEGHAGTPVEDYLPADCQIDWVRVYNAK